MTWFQVPSSTLTKKYSLAGLQLHTFVCWGLAKGRESKRGVRIWTAHCQLHQGGQNCPRGDHNQLTQKGIRETQIIEFDRGHML